MDECKEGKTVMMSHNILLVFSAAMLLFALYPAFAQEQTGTLEVFIKNESNDRAPPENTFVKIYQDQNTVPYQTLDPLESNPFKTSLPMGHSYKVEVYVDSIYAGVAFANMNQNQVKLDIPIRNSGGIRLTVYYSDGYTPFPNVQVLIKSPDGKLWGSSDTDENGQTIRSWLQSTIRQDDHYYAEIVLGPKLKYVFSPLNIQPNVSQEVKVVTNWPKLVDKLITVEVYNSTKNKVTMQDGSFVAQLFDAKKKMTAESAVTDKGVAHFSNLKVGTYTIYVKEKDASGNLNLLVAKKVTVTNSIDTIKIYINNPSLNSDNLVCNCVAFRLDDIQDYYLAPAQREIISMFEKRDVPLTIGVIGGVTGADPNLVSAIKGGLEAKHPIEVASHSWNNRVLTSLSKTEQAELIKKTNDKIKTIFGVEPTTFIPPENLFNADTLDILKSDNFTHISYSVATKDPPPFKKSSFYHFPTAAASSILDPSTGFWKPQSVQQIHDAIEGSMLDYGYAVVMMHPYEFSNYENGFYTNNVNSTRVQQMGSLIDELQSENYKILQIGSIEDYDKIEKPSVAPGSEPSQKVGPPNCNCVAFRIDNVQDYYLNDVQNMVIGKFDEKRTPVTIGVIGKFFGSDPKTVNFIKDKVANGTIDMANRGWEYVDHTGYSVDKQSASIMQTNDKIYTSLHVKADIFSPPMDLFNKDTVQAVKQNKMQYFSSTISADTPAFSESPKHIPSTLQFANLIDDDPFLTGTIPQKAQAKIKSSIDKYGYAVISLQPQDFALKDKGGVSMNQIDQGKLDLLGTVIGSLETSKIDVASLKQVSLIMEEKSIVVPDWVKNNAGWWSEGKIGDSDFTKGLEYLISQDIIRIPKTTGTVNETQAIPDWVKNNAGWWSEGKIGNSDFVKGIQFLIEKGIVRV